MDGHSIVTIALIHRILVTIFLFHYLWKAYLLIRGKKETLANYTAKTRIAEMVVALSFLATGLLAAIAWGSFGIKQIGIGDSSTWTIVWSASVVRMWLKVIMVFASIPVAIIGFKKGNKGLAALAVVLLIGAYGLAEINKKKQGEGNVDTKVITGDALTVGKAIYTDKCMSCHGAQGDGNFGGAKNLKTTQLSDEEIKNIVCNGVPGTGMASYKELINDEQLDDLVIYIRTLK